MRGRRSWRRKRRRNNRRRGRGRKSKMWSWGRNGRGSERIVIRAAGACDCSIGFQHSISIVIIVKGGCVEENGWALHGGGGIGGKFVGK